MIVVFMTTLLHKALRLRHQCLVRTYEVDSSPSADHSNIYETDCRVTAGNNICSRLIRIKRKRLSRLSCGVKPSRRSNSLPHPEAKEPIATNRPEVPLTTDMSARSSGDARGARAFKLRTRNSDAFRCLIAAARSVLRTLGVDAATAARQPEPKSSLTREASFDTSQSKGVQGEVRLLALGYHRGSERRRQLHRDGSSGLIKAGFRQYVLDIREDRETALFTETTGIARVAHHLPFIACASMPIAVVSVLTFDLIDCEEDSVVGLIERGSDRLTTVVVLGIFGNA